MLISKNPKVKGKILFHAKLINKSYRNRGSVARAQIQKNTKKTVKKIAKKLVGLGLKITVDLNILKKKILAYSAIKIIANPPDPYSILNPETSSDSNGRRLPFFALSECATLHEVQESISGSHGKVRAN